MTTLEFCYELEFSKINFIERKTRITHPKTLISGPPKSGKSFLIFDYLSNFENEDYIYIDFNDYRNEKEEIKNSLEEFIFKNKIKVIVLENFSFSFDFEIPNCDSIIISTKSDTQIKGFKKLFLTPLDFEEYLLHDKKNQIITQSFNLFLKNGNLPGVVNIDEIHTFNRLHDLIILINKDITTQEILKILFFSIDEKKSLNQLYLTLKTKIKISKDKFYEECKNFEKNKIIYFIAKYEQDKAVKKIYSYNPAFLAAITHKKKFKNELTNMIFCELVNKYKNIYYLDYIDFYIPSKNLAIISIPFFNSMLMQSQLRKIKKIVEEYEINELYIITVSNNEHLIQNNFEINVIPFYEWALS
jgi:hypothetical protein